MGIQTKTMTVCTCDLCGAACRLNDGDVRIQVHPGDGRDVGPGFMHATMSVDLPYRVNKGIVCRSCKVKWLRAYLTEQGATP